MIWMFPNQFQFEEDSGHCQSHLLGDLPPSISHFMDLGVARRLNFSFFVEGHYLRNQMSHNVFTWLHASAT